MIELMFSILIITLVILGAIYALLEAHNMSKDSRGRLLALTAARATLEAIKDTPLADIGTVDGDGFLPEELDNGDVTISTNPADVSDEDLATVTVTVTWNGAKNRVQSLQMSTMRSSF